MIEFNRVPAGIETYREIFKWLCALADVWLAAELVRRFLQTERAGRILLDLGRIHEERFGFMQAYGAAGILIGVFGVLVSRLNFQWPYFLFLALQGVNLVANGSQRFLIREAGIQTTLKRGVVKLLRWEDVLDYNLDNGKLFLNLRDKGWMNCRPRVRLDYEDELEALLAARYPKPHEPVAVY